jgi:hypothetical protein
MPGTWQPLANPPTFNASTMLLLTDGTVMCHESGGKNWWRLTPDAHGDYVHGTWSALAPMKNTRLYYASEVLADGRVFVAGGEYSDAGGDTNTAEIYDPLSNTWTSLPNFDLPGWNKTLGDVPACTLADGRILLGSIVSNNTATFDPATNTFTAAATKEASNSNEETWTLLPDGSVETVECRNSPKAERYIPAQNKWVTAGSTPVDLVQASSIEIGPALLLPDGRVFAIGATGHTALYTPPTSPGSPGTWVAGPDFPKDSTGKLMEAKDAPACLLTNGKVLCVAGPAGEGGSFPGPTQFFEYDGTALNTVPNPPNATGPPFVGRLLVIPSGQVLFAAGTNQIQVYTPDGHPHPSWRPGITSCPTYIQRGGTYTLHGTQINGLSQANSYGDDAQMATNYPIIAVFNQSSGTVTYARTHGHSTMGVATGSTIHSTTFSVCPPVDGEYELYVIANGIASASVAVSVGSSAAPLGQNIAINDAAVAFVLRRLTDGPLLGLTPQGPIPVDSSAPEQVQAVREAYQSIIAAVKVLRDAGRAAQAKQAATPTPTPIVDPRLQGGDGDT